MGMGVGGENFHHSAFKVHSPSAGRVFHYTDVIMGTIASQITSLTIIYSTVYSEADQGKYQSTALLAFVWGIHRRPVNSPHKWPVTRKMFPFDDVIMHWKYSYILVLVSLVISACISPYKPDFFIYYGRRDPVQSYSTPRVNEKAPRTVPREVPQITIHRTQWIKPCIFFTSRSQDQVLFLCYQG